MPGEQDAILNVRVKISTAELRRELSQARADIKELERQAKAGVISPATARQDIVGIAAKAEALKEKLRTGQGTEAQVKELTKFIKTTGDSYKKLSDSNVSVAQANRDYVRMVQAASARLLQAAAKGTPKDPFEKAVKTISDRTSRNTRLVEDPVANAARAAEEASKERLKQDRISKQLEARALYQDAIVLNEAEQVKLAATEKALLLQILGEDEDYLKAATLSAVGQKQNAAIIAAGTNTLLATNQSYIQNLATAQAAQRRINIQRDTLVEKDIASSPFDHVAVGQLEALRRQRAVREETAAEGFLAADKGLALATGNLAAIRRRREIAEANATLLMSAGDVDAEGRLAAAQKQRAAAIEVITQRELRNSNAYIADAAQAQLLRRQIDTRRDLRVERGLAAEPTEAVAAGNLAGLRHQREIREQTAMEKFLATDKALADATGSLAALRRRREIEERQAFLRASKNDLQAEARLAAAEQARRAGIGAAGVGLRRTDPLFNAQAQQTISQEALVEARRLADTAARRAQTQQALAADETVLRQNLAATQAAEAERKLAVESQVRQKLGQSFVDRQATEEVAKSAAAERKRLVVIQATLRGDEQLLQLQAQRIIQSKVLQAAERELAQETLKQAIRQGSIAGVPIGRGSFIQRVQAGVASRQGGPVRLPTDFATGPQLLRGSLVTTARFAASGALLYGGFQVLKNTIKTAEELEVELGILRSQFESIGRLDALKETQARILDIAQATGTAVDEAVRLGIAFVGAFGPETGARALEIATKIGVIAGIEPGEVFNDLVAGAKAFNAEDPTTGLQELADVTTKLRNTTGVSQKEQLDFLGRVGPVAQAAGLTLEEASAAGAALLQGSGVGGAGLGEQFGRILTGFQAQSVEIAKIVGANSSLRASIAQARGGDYASFARDLNAGDASVLFDLAKGFDDLTDSQQRQVISSIGSRREGQTLAVLLQNSKTLIASRAQALNSSGTAETEFLRRTQSLNFQMKQLGVEFQQFALGLYNSALRGFLLELVNVGKIAVAALTLVMNVFSGLNDVTNGWAGQIVKALALARVLASVVKGIGGLGAAAFGGVAGRLFGGGAAAAPLTGAATALTGSAGALTAAAGALSTAAGVQGATGLLGPDGRPLVGPAAPATGPLNWRGVPRGTALTPIGRSGIGGAVSGGLARFGFNGLTLGLAGAVAVASKYVSTQSKVNAAAEGFEARLREMTDAEVEAIASQKTGRFDRFALTVFGQESPEGMGADELRRRESVELNQPDRLTVVPGIIQDVKDSAYESVRRELDTQLRALVPSGDKQVAEGFSDRIIEDLREDPQAFVEQLKRDLDEGKENSVQVAEAVLTALATIPGFANDTARALVDLAQRRSGEETRAAFDEGTLQASAEQLKAQFQAGEISSGAFIRGMTEYRKELERAIEGGGAASPAMADEIASAQKDINDVLSKGAANFLEFQNSLIDLRGGGEEQKIDLAVAALRDPSLTDPTARRNIAESIFSLSQALLDAEVSALDDAEAQIALLKAGIAIPDEARAEVLKAAISEISPLWVQFLDQNFSNIVDSANFVNDVVSLAIELGIGVAAAARQIIERQLAEAKRLRDSIRNNPDLNPGQKRLLLDDYQNKPTPETPPGGALLDIPDLPDINIPDVVVGNEDDIRRREEEQRRRADEEAKRAAEEARRQAIAARQAQRDLDLARRGDDPVSKAYTDILLANDAIAVAETAADRINAQASRIRAERALADAFNEIGVAQLGLAQAMYDYAGEPVKSAQVALDIAKRQLAHLRTTRPNDTQAILQAQADVVNQEAALRDANLSERERAIDVALQLEQITVQQAIAQLRALLEIPGLTQEQTDQLLIKIKGLQDDLSRDFQFNLPTDLLPTLYVARRLKETGGDYQGLRAGDAGGGIVDARQINISFTANNVTEAGEIANVIIEEFSRPTRFGTAPRRF